VAKSHELSALSHEFLKPETRNKQPAIFYEINYRVRRYAESFVGQGNRIDVIALKDNDKKAYSVLNGGKYLPHTEEKL